MKAEKELKNFWKDTAGTYKTANEGEKPAGKTDVIIIGNSIAALTTALVLQQEGKKCTVLLPADLTHANIETSNLTSIPGPNDLSNKNNDGQNIQLLAQSKREAIDLAEGLVNKYDIDCDFTYQTGYLFAQTDKQTGVLEHAETLARRAGIVSRPAANIPVPLPYQKAYRFDFQAQLHPLKYLLALAAAFEAEGGTLATGIATAIDHTNGITMHTTTGVLHAQALVLADDDAQTMSATPTNPACCYNIAFTLKDGMYPEGITCAVTPESSFTTFASDGQQYIVASRFANHNEDGMAVLSELESYLNKYFPINKITHQWMANYYPGLNDMPEAGRLPGYKNIYRIAGLGSNAIVNGSIAAKIVCSLICNKHSDYERLYENKS